MIAENETFERLCQSDARDESYTVRERKRVRKNMSKRSKDGWWGGLSDIENFKENESKRA
jgi:hypothetical protein